MAWIRNFFLFNDNVQLLPSTYDPILIVLSILVSIFSSFIALQMIGQSSPDSSRTGKLLILFAASLALGCGVWAMHFIGMLSFQLCVSVSYDKTLTIVSMFPSFIASMIALAYVGRPKIHWVELVVGGVLVGSGIGSMHYTGMAAMRTDVLLRYDPIFFALSILVAVVLAILSLWVRFGLSDLKLSKNVSTLVAGSVMGLAISGMHYTGMFAARFIGLPETSLNGAPSNPTFLALAVSITTITFTLFTFAVNAFIRYRKLVNNLRVSETRMRAIVTTAVDGIFTLNANGTILDFNESAEKIFGYQSSEVIGKNIDLLLPEAAHSRNNPDPNDPEGRRLLGKYIGTGQESFGMRKNTGRFPIRLAVGYAQLPNEGILVGFVTDISEQKMIENALKQSELQKRSLIENIPGVTYRCLFNDKWTIVFLSEAMEKLTGYPVSDFMEPNPKRYFVDLIIPEDKEPIGAVVAEAVRMRKSFVLEYRILDRYGEIKWCWGHGSAIFGGNGEVLFLDGVILDITERRNMEEELRRSMEKAELAALTKTSFLANMSHEIRTPMNSIIGFTEVLLSAEPKKEQIGHLEIIKGSAKSLLRLLNDILNTAKLEKGAVELEINTFSLFKLISELKSIFGLNARKKNLEFEVIRDPNLNEFFIGDSLRVRQILTNLIGNAIKFTDRGKVTFEIKFENPYIHFSIRDTGIGIRADRLEKIFEPFTQADISTTRRYGGTGLGTTICKQLTDLMKGEIWAESNFGKGSVFHVRLPLSPNTSLDSNKERSLDFRYPKLRILIVDDMEKNTELLKLLLSKEGHTITSALSGEEAVQIYAEETFDLIFMDVQMPGIDGHETARIIRFHEMQENVQRTPIIALTASVFQEDRDAAKESGMDGFVAKPIDLPELLSEMAAVLHLNGVSPVPKAEKVSSLEVPNDSEKERMKILFVEILDNFQRGTIEDEPLNEFLRLISGKVEEERIERFISNVNQFELEEARSRLYEFSEFLNIPGI
ncbi:MHYT domain-containing protein [Leptospira kmetyi]|uniref:MHYT domain-containing protein n=1 Tax=Leptospira kmetyi TaxID=408139 RepID=UPI001082EC9F|nr:MHYT domain-containing protein [Leptospira kmetyi]TGK14935.1 PAS domain S-box protein [Leptospira kmetyi]TGK33450.1 PAS domain S-box protein [Leptospira kmetyi]